MKSITTKKVVLAAVLLYISDMRKLVECPITGQCPETSMPPYPTNIHRKSVDSPKSSPQTVYVCGGCGFKGNLSEVTSHSQQCTHPASDNSNAAIENSTQGVCNVPPIATPPDYLESQETQHPSTAAVTTPSASTAGAPAAQATPVPHDEADRAMLMWTPELINIMVERFVIATKEVGPTAQKKKVYERVAEEVQSRTGMAVTGEQVGNKIKFMRKQHMALKAMMMANKPVPANKMSPHFKALDEIFSKDPSSSPLNKALEKCLGGKVKVINSAKGQQSSPIVVLQQPADERSTLGSAFSQYIAKLIDELDDDQKDEIQAYIISYIFSLKQQNRVTATTTANASS